MSEINTLQKMELLAYKASLNYRNYLQSAGNKVTKPIKDLINLINNHPNLTISSLLVCNLGLLASATTMGLSTGSTLDIAEKAMMASLLGFSTVATASLFAGDILEKTSEYLKDKSSLEKNHEPVVGNFVCKDINGEMCNVSREEILLLAANKTLTDHYTKIVFHSNDELELTSDLTVRNLSELPYYHKHTALDSEKNFSIGGQFGNLYGGEMLNDHPDAIERTVRSINYKAIMEAQDDAIAYAIMKEINVKTQNTLSITAIQEKINEIKEAHTKAHTIVIDNSNPERNKFFFDNMKLMRDEAAPIINLDLKPKQI